MLYKNCRELPYHNFNEVQVEEDLTYLIKDKDFKKEFESLRNIENDKELNFDKEQQILYDKINLELKEHWINILEEYFTLTNDFSQSKFFRDKAELNYLQLKLNILKYLQPLTNAELNNEQEKQIDVVLKKYRVSDIEQDILGTTDEVNLKINRFNIAYNNEKKSNFDETLAMMRMNGCQVNRHETTVTEWVALLAQMKKQASANNGRKRRFN